MFFLEKSVGSLKAWELYIAFVVLQILIGLVIAIFLGIFDILGIRGLLRSLVKSIGVATNARSPQQVIAPVASEIAQNKYI